MHICSDVLPFMFSFQSILLKVNLFNISNQALNLVNKSWYLGCHIIKIVVVEKLIFVPALSGTLIKYPFIRFTEHK